MLGLFKRTKAYNNVKAQEFEQLLQEKNTVLLDVRTADEFRAGHIKGAKNIDYFSSFKSKISQLDKDKHYLLYCRSGARSSNACQLMTEAGFEHLSNLSGGIGAWRGPIAQ